jgi:predicted RNA polymerase sigma factor
MRLCNMLVENEATNKPQVNALLALMCFHASRLDARMNESGELILYEEQDTGLWNDELISKGAYFLSRSASGNRASKYHLEAAIAWWQTQREDTNEKWEQMLQLHDQLLQIEYSPIAALNRAYALSKVNGKAAAIEAAEQVSLDKHHLYHALLADLYIGIDNAKAMTHLQKAMSLARSAADRAILTRKILLYEQKNTA